MGEAGPRREHLRGEEDLRHASLQDFRDETQGHACPRQRDQASAANSSCLE
jgi:hypothetical protein